MHAPSNHVPVEYGYARVSTPPSRARKAQHVDNQVERLKAHGIPAERIFVDDGQSGRLKSRPGWDACLEALGAGDILVCTKLDRIGRSLMNLVDVVNLLRKRNVSIRCLDTGEVDTTTANGEFFFHIMSAMAQWESRMAADRTREGLTAARERHGGKLPMRGLSIRPDQIATAKMLASTTDMSAQRIADVIGVSRATLYRHIPIGDLRSEAVAP